MALFRITVTRRKNTAGMLIEPGMSVQIASFVNNPVTNIQECKKSEPTLHQQLWCRLR